MKFPALGLTAITLSLISAAFSLPAQAQNAKGFTAGVIQECRENFVQNDSRNGPEAVAAVASRFGNWSCSQHTYAQNTKNLLARTLRTCNAAMTKAQREIAPCEPLYANGTVFDNATSQALNKSAQIPVEYTLRFADGRPEVRHRGRIRFLNEFTGSGRAIEIVSDKGQLLCRGSHILRGKAMYFALICDYQYGLASPLFKAKGYVEQNGLYLPQFETTLIETQVDWQDGTTGGLSSNQRNNAVVSARGLELTLRTVP